MLYLLGLIAVSALALGCQSISEESKKAPPAEPKSPGPPDSHYDRTCLGRSDCEEKTLLAAASDYAGAVYGDSPLLRYDGILRGQERRAIAEKLGELRRASDIPDYFRTAREKFLAAHRNPKRGMLCQESSRFSTLEASHPRWGEARALGGLHDCGAAFGELYFRGGLEFLVASRPQDWVFFIEPVEHEGSEAKLEENALFHRIAEALEIPVRNPVVSILSDEVIGRLESRHGLRRIDVAVSFTLGRIHEQFANDPALASSTPEQLLSLEHEAVRRIFLEGRSKPAEREALGIYAARLGVPFSELWKECGQVAGGTGGSGPRAYAQRLESRVQKVKPLLGKISNQLSAERVRQILGQEHRPKAFFQVGQGHLPIVEEVYRSGP